MNNIEQIHEEVFIALDNWSEYVRTNNNEINPFFYMRSVRDERFQRGFWFPGNDSYISISFWAGGDLVNKTPNVYFEIHEKFGCRIIIVAKDSESKYSYFEKMVAFLNRKEEKYIFQQKSKMWIKKISNSWQDWSNELGHFINNDKKDIDKYIINNEVIYHEEFVSKFEFILSNEFDIIYSNILKERNRIKEEKYNKSVEFRNLPKLPYALLAINIENFQGVKNTNINELRPNSKWIFITGENGYGKTTILQSIALGLVHDPELEKYLDDKTRINIELISNNEKNFIIKTKDTINNHKNISDYGQYVIGYGPARLNVQSRSSENKENKSLNNVLSLFENDSLLKNINYELFASNYSDTKTFVELEEIIRAVTKGRIAQIKVLQREVYFIETLTNGEQLEPLPLNKLAAGFRSIINIVLDIYLRLKKVHFNSTYKNFYGIVLIDEIENHLHPILQRELPITLSEVFPKIQFIVSTHSPIPLLAADKNSIILKVNRDKSNGVTLERLDEIIDFPNLLPNTILTSPIFGFQNIFSESKNDDKFLRVETTYSEIIKNDENKKIIADYLSDETTSAILNIIKKK